MGAVMDALRLLTFDQAAAEMGVPVASLRSAADEHGLTIRMGRAVRIHPDDLGRLIELCRVGQKDRACTGAQTANSTRSATPAASVSRPARQAASKLKARSRVTSTESTGQLVRLSQER